MHKEDPNQSYFSSLLKRYRQGNILPEEKDFLDKYYDLFEGEKELIDDENETQFDTLKQELKAKIDRQVVSSTHQEPPRIKFNPSVFYRYGIAALLLMSLGFGIYFINLKKNPINIGEGNLLTEIPGGTNKAILSLGDGREINLNESTSENILKNEGVRIVKNAEGSIQYMLNSEDHNRRPEMHKISTPNGGRYTVVLPDGSTVILNAASSLRFPAFFDENVRVVELEGEAYFDIASNKAMPFIVKSGIQQVEVLGTRFNVNSYQEEKSIKTTLLEGSVKIVLGPNGESAAGKEPLLLLPGEQARISKGPAAIIRKNKVNTHKEIAWKDGLFSFENDDLPTIMKQISRWYDVHVIYEGKLSGQKFFGEISRDSQLAEVLTILEYNNIHFRLEGRNLYVSVNPNSQPN